MSASAKLTAVTLLAAAALGAAVVTQGCTVTSGTVDDTDGGTQNTSGGTSGTSGTSGGSTDGDGGSDSGSSGGGETCNPGEFPTSLDETCQACLEQKCCADLKTCFGITPEGENLSCQELAECVNDAEDETVHQACVDSADPAVQEAYGRIVGCADNNCAAECGGGEQPDG